MKPIELLKLELSSYKKALIKSIEAFNNNEINEDIHNLHKKILNMLINEYEKIINILKTWEHH